MTVQRRILWFRNDLRLLDNYIVAEAVRARANSRCEVVPVYVFDPRHFGTTQYGARKTGHFRAQFIVQSVRNLKMSLRAIGNDLLVVHGLPEEVIPPLLLEDRHNEVFTQEEVTDEELQIDSKLLDALRLKNATLTKLWGSTLYHRDDLPMTVPDMQEVFTPWKDEVESKSTIRDCVPAPSADELGSIPEDLKHVAEKTMPSFEDLGYSRASIDSLQQPEPRAALAFVGGEEAGLARVEEYIWERDCLKDYFETRNGLIGADYSTKFSPWLALGCLSPRFLHHEALRYERARVKNKSTYWLSWELTCRDFFRFKSLKHGTRIFKRAGIANRHQQWVGAGEELERWKEGRTGVPLVDANMRELRLTGFMSNRGRQNVASYLTQELKVDWRLGAAWFEELLVDHDVCSNWANWNAAGGVAGGRVNRFNMVKQSADYDPDGAYCRLWLPELCHVPGAKVHQPWLLTEEEQRQYNVRVGPAPAQEAGDACGQAAWYPLPMVPPQTMPDPTKGRKKKTKQAS